MPAIPLAPWAPDVAGVDASFSDNWLNVNPRGLGVGPVQGLGAVSAPLPADAKGAVEVATVDGTARYFAGTATKLYSLNLTTLAWVDVSGPSPYSVTDDDYWSFVRFGDFLIACHVNAAPQWINLKTGTAFADLVGTGTSAGSNPPRARFCSVVGDYLVLGGLLNFPEQLAWSAFNNVFGWVAGVDGSDIQPFPDGGTVMGVTGGDYGLVFQKSSIRRMVLTGDYLNPFQITRVEEDRGAISPWSIVKSGGKVFFLDTDGFYQFQDGGSLPIGAQVCNSWFADAVDNFAIRRAYAVRDVSGQRVMWAFKSASDSRGVLDRTLTYDWLLQKWAPGNQAARLWLRSVTLSKTLDSMTTGSVDDLMISFDSPFYSGGVPQLGAMTIDNRLAFRSGLPLAASVETQEGMISRPRRTFVRGSRIDTDADTFTVSMGGREDLSKPVVYGPARAREVTGFCPARSSARYHRGRIDIPAGTSWSYITGMEPDGVPEGGR